MEIVKFVIRKRVAAALGLILLGMAELSAQSGTAPVTVTSNPSGTTVVLAGDFTVSGVTPTTFTQNLSGFYRITAYRSGFETHRSSVVLSGSSPMNINLKLSPKTRVKAGVRSLLIPGWGQRYSDQKTKGALLTLGAVTGGVVLGILHLKFDDERDKYYDLQDRYNAEREVAKREELLDDLFNQQKKARDAEQDRKLGGAILAGIWAYNILDAVLFFPDYGTSISGANLSVSPFYEHGAVGFTGKVKF